jgi:hypothetical protein
LFSSLAHRCRQRRDIESEEESNVNRKFLNIATGVALIAATAAPAFAADLTPQPVGQVNVTQLADGYRSSKLVGAAVVNDEKQSIGKIDDLLVGRSDKVLYAVLSVGGFLGVGSKLVAVPYSSLQIGAKDVILPGGSKEQLKALPEFKYATS